MHDAGRMDGQPTREDSATQLLICEMQFQIRNSMKKNIHENAYWWIFVPYLIRVLEKAGCFNVGWNHCHLNIFS